MHYIRLLRAPRVSRSGARLHAELLFTITTDLGDAFLLVEKPLDIVVTAHSASATGTTSHVISAKGQTTWQPHMRVAKPLLPLPKAVEAALSDGGSVELKIAAAVSAHSAESAGDILEAAAVTNHDPGNPRDAGGGLVMPVWVNLTLQSPVSAAVALRKLYLSSDNENPVLVEEELGESIAKHVWDAGVVTFSALAGLHSCPDHHITRGPCLQTLMTCVTNESPPAVLELGCGVGILSAGLAAVLPLLRGEGSAKCHILMTDLPDAEQTARANIEHAKTRVTPTSEVRVHLEYENLDWDAGRLGNFGAATRARRWDIIMLSDCTYNVDVLPALVGTLSALHELNTHSTSRARCAADEAAYSTKVLLATKPRHASEQLLFELMMQSGWTTKTSQIIPLPNMDGEAAQVELYLFEKS